MPLNTAIAARYKRFWCKSRPGLRLPTSQSASVAERRYFASVPEVAWNFYIGGYQAAQRAQGQEAARIEL
jgi:hypothetical protein